TPPPCQYHLPSLPQYPPGSHEPLLATPRAKLSHGGSVCAGVHPMPSLSRSHQRKPPTMAISPSLPSSIPSLLTRAPVSHPHGQTEPRRVGFRRGTPYVLPLRSHQRKPPTMPTSSSLPSSIPSLHTQASVIHPQGQAEPQRLSLPRRAPYALPLALAPTQAPHHGNITFLPFLN